MEDKGGKKGKSGAPLLYRMAPSLAGQCTAPLSPSPPATRDGSNAQVARLRMFALRLVVAFFFPMVLGSVALAENQPNDAVASPKDNAMTKTTAHSPRTAVVLTADKFEDMEVYFPVFRLQEEGWIVTVAAPTMDTIYGEHGYALRPDTTIDAINPDDFDLLIIPGGSPEGAPSTVRKITKAQDIAKSFFAKNKPVAAICHGPYTLVSAGLVNGRHLTSYWHDGVPEEIRQAGGIWEDKEVVVDGNLVSSRWPLDLPAFMRELVKLTNSGKQ